MTHFVGTIDGRLDGKGRLAIPADFRAQLPAVAGQHSLVLRPSHKFDCLEGWAWADFEQLSKPMDTLDIFSDSEDDLSYVLYGTANPCTPDKDGRIIVPPRQIRHARLSDAVVFVGLRRKFEIWSEAAWDAHLAAVAERARATKPTLPGRVVAEAGP